MDFTLLIFFLLGAALTYGGWQILFTKKGLEWMYKNGIWEKESSIFNEHQLKRFNRHYGGGGIFALGLILLFGSLIAFWFEFFK